MVSNSKVNAAKKAAEMIEDGMVVGMGSGSTAELFIKELGKRIQSEGVGVKGVVSSFGSQIIAVNNGIPIYDLLQFPKPDIYVDGADEIDTELNCIKGGGAALTREKVLAYASNKFVIIIDSSKHVDLLKMPIPVEVLPFSYGFVKRKITEMGGKASLRLAKEKFGPVITDNGNFILDCDFGNIKEPEKLENSLNSIPGVIDNGIFNKEVVDTVITGKEDGYIII